MQQQFDELFQRMLEDPTNLDLMFEFAGVATRIGDFEAAISTLERMLLLNPNLPRVKLELGVLYFRLGSYAVARSYLEDARDAPGAPAIVKERVEAYLDEIDQRQSRHQFAGSVGFGARYQTNANAGPGSSDVLAGGNDSVLDDEFLGQPDWNVFVNAQGRHSYTLESGSQDSWDSTAQLYSTQQFKFGELDLNLFALTTGPRFSTFEGEFDDLSVRPFLLTEVVTLGNEMHFVSFGAGAEASKRLTERISVNGQYTFRYRDFINSDSEPNNGEQDGFENDIYAGLQIFLTDNLLYGVGLFVTDENTAREYNSNTEFGGSVSLGLQYAAPFGLTDFPWRSSLNAQYLVTDYKAPDPSVDPNNARLDHEWRLGLTNVIGVTEDLSLLLQVQHNDNDSNLPNFVYENTLVLFGGIWTY